MKMKVLFIAMGIAVASQIVGARIAIAPDQPLFSSEFKASFGVDANDKLKSDAFQVLDSRCNTCHRRQNPLMIFKPQNMEKRAKKIYQMVFVERRMPKGNEVKLTNEEYNQLEKWLRTQEIY